MSSGAGTALVEDEVRSVRASWRRRIAPASSGLALNVFTAGELSLSLDIYMHSKLP